MARTTLDIDEDLVSKGMAVTGAPSKKALIEEAVRELIRSRARQEFIDFIRSGEPAADMTVEELIALRRGTLERIDSRDESEE